jgi:hypothetical protein
MSSNTPLAVVDEAVDGAVDVGIDVGIDGAGAPVVSDAGDASG